MDGWTCGGCGLEVSEPNLHSHTARGYFRAIFSPPALCPAITPPTHLPTSNHLQLDTFSAPAHLFFWGWGALAYPQTTRSGLEQRC